MCSPERRHNLLNQTTEQSVRCLPHSDIPLQASVNIIFLQAASSTCTCLSDYIVDQ